ncbi:MAG: hypothetical protein GXO07_04630 [Crenarchaeota archaeon]|nr:hypothetical protein [Thermoproteota archaeon]
MVAEAEVVVFVPPFLGTSLISILLFIIAKNKLGWGYAYSITLASLLSALLGALMYIVMTIVLGCPPCKVP